MYSGARAQMTVARSSWAYTLWVVSSGAGGGLGLDLRDEVEQAAAAGEDARVMFIGGAGTGGPLNLEDLPMLKANLRVTRASKITYLDIMTLVRTCNLALCSCEL